jgi:hypothetical protein
LDACIVLKQRVIVSASQKVAVGEGRHGAVLQLSDFGAEFSVRRSVFVKRLAAEEFFLAAPRAGFSPDAIEWTDVEFAEYTRRIVVDRGSDAVRIDE